MSHTLPTALLMTAAALAFAPERASGRGENTELYVVPAPANVVVDGSLADWDLSGQVNNYVIPETRETMSARLAMMYDAEALYVGGVVRDSSPMMNRHDPQTNPARAWDADVCQIFFGLDPDAKQPLQYSSFDRAHDEVDVGTMLLWYFTDREEPTMAMFRGMKFVKALRPDLHENGHLPGQHFEAAYRKGDDGLSYTFEYRIPWATLPMKRVPVAGDTLGASLAVFWSRPDGLKTAGGAAWAWNVMSRPGFPYQSSAVWGTLRFVPEGNIPREWVTGHLPPEQPLPLTLTYDLPREGEATIQLFDEDNRAVRILAAQQFRPEGVNTERWDGLDDQGQPLSPGRYFWRGQVSDPIKAEYRFSVHNSGQPPYPTDDDTGGWGADHGAPTTVLALDDGMILAWNVAEYGWGIIRTDLEGRKKWGSKQSANHLASDGERLFFAGRSFSGDAGVRVMDVADSRPLNFQPGMATLPVPEGVGLGDATGLAFVNDIIYVSYAAHDRIAVHAKTGEMLHVWEIPSPGRLAGRPDGSLAVLSGDRLLAVRDGQIERTIVDGLDTPAGVAVSATGELYVSQAGEVQQVQVFDATGARLRTLGRDGGRPAIGAYDASGMYMPGGLDLDAKGRLWVAETTDSPKRIGVWDAQSGANLKEFFGGSYYFAYGFIDADRPTEILAHNVLWEIDWKTGKTIPKTTIWRKTEPNMVGPAGVGGYLGNPRIVTADNGRQYLWGRTRHYGVLMRRDGDLFKPFAAIFEINRRGGLYRGVGIPLLEEDEATHPNGYYFWQDRNDDQTVQPEEVTRLPRGYGRNFFAWLDPDLRAFIASGLILEPTEISAAGQPIYDLEAARHSPLAGKREAALGYSYQWRDDQGLSYTYQEGQQMIAWDGEGKPRWSYPHIARWRDALGMPITGPGKLWGMTGNMGVAGDYFAMMTYFNPNHIFALDGRYVAAVLGDSRLGGRGPYQGQPEGQGGTFVKLDLDGRERYFIIHGGQDVRVWEVKGLDTIQKLAGGVYEHTAEAAATARNAFEQWQAAKAGRAELTIVRGRDALDQALPVGKTIDDQRQFEARVAYDENNLYVRYDVRTPHPLVNATAEEMLVFRGGNCLDLQIATDPNADPERKTPAPGDLRLLVTRQAGKPFAMLYRPRLAGFDGQRIVLESPTGSEPFDAISRDPRVGLEYQQAKGSFTAVLTVPLALLGWQPQSGQSVKIDLGYIFGNATGTRAAIRGYWNNNSFSANVVDDIPNESRLEPAQWGEATVE